MKNLLKKENPLSLKQHYSHILLNIQLREAVADIYCDFIYIFSLSAYQPECICVITSLSLNRKTIECCKSLPQALRRRLLFPINVDGWGEVKTERGESEKEIKDKVNRLVDVESRAASFSKKKKNVVLAGRETKKGFSRDYQRNCMFQPFTEWKKLEGRVGVLGLIY